MIYGIQGKPGGGKSYECVVNHIIPALKQGRKIVTNIPLNVDHFVSVFGDGVRDLIEVIDGEFHNYGGQRPFSKKEHYLQYEDWQNDQGQKVYFFVDEAHLPMPSGGTDKELLEFLSMHRHYGFDIMFLSQTFRKIHRDARDMIQVGFRAIKKAHMGQPDKYILKVHDGASASNSTVIDTKERKYESKYFAFYSSHTKSNKAIQEAQVSDVKKWWHHWSFYGFGASIFLAIFIFSFAFSNSSEKPSLDNSHHSNQSFSAPSDSLSNSASRQHNSISHSNSVNSTRPKREPEPQPDPEPEPESKAGSKTEPKKQVHPFHKVSLHITGWADYTDRGRRKKDYYLSASQNGQHVFDISLRDLYLAGYTVVVRSACMIEVQFDGYHEYLTCDSPTVTIDASFSGDK